MSQQQKCSQCLEQFALANPPRSMPNCGHNICTKCLKEAIQIKQDFIDCQFCAKKTNKKQIRLFPKNLKLIEKIRKENTINSSPKQQKQLFTSQSTQKIAIDSIKEEEELLICTDHSLSTQTYLYCNINDKSTICQIHKKPFEIICATDKQRICPHCAIFGNHKDHRFRTTLQFQQEIKQKTLHFQFVLKQKQDTQKSQQWHNGKQKINFKIIERKNLILKQIQRTYQEWITTIKKQQKHIQDELTQKFNAVNAKIIQNMMAQINLKKNYLSWERSCQDTVNLLKMTKNEKKRIQIYYESPLQICEEGDYYLDEMTKDLTAFYREIDEKINSISIKTQQKSFDGLLSLVFPILEESTPIKQLANIQDSFAVDFPCIKNQLVTRQDLNQNQFIFDLQISQIQFQIPKSQKKTRIDKLNRSQTSLNSFNSTTNLSLFTNITPAKNRELQKYEREKDKAKTILSRVKSNHRSFEISDFSKTVTKIKAPKTPEQILIKLMTNDFINEVDLSQLYLNDKQIKQFLIKAKAIRPLKAIKLENNKLTDVGFQQICHNFQHVFNLNLSCNNLTDRCLNTIIKNKEYLYKMRIINLSHNKMSSDRTDNRIKEKLLEIKKMGIMITL